MEQGVQLAGVSRRSVAVTATIFFMRTAFRRFLLYRTQFPIKKAIAS